MPIKLFNWLQEVYEVGVTKQMTTPGRFPAVRDARQFNPQFRENTRLAYTARRTNRNPISTSHTVAANAFRITATLTPATANKPITPVTIPTHAATLPRERLRRRW